MGRTGSRLGVLYRRTGRLTPAQSMKGGRVIQPTCSAPFATSGRSSDIPAHSGTLPTLSSATVTAQGNGAELDHVVVAVTDLAEASRAIEADHGSTTREGGRHPRWGMANRIVPLGDAISSWSRSSMRRSQVAARFGRWVSESQTDHPLCLVGWAVRTQALDEVSSRLGLTIEAGSRTGCDGKLVEWRLAGVEEAAADPALPFSPLEERRRLRQSARRRTRFGA